MLCRPTLPNFFGDVSGNKEHIFYALPGCLLRSFFGLNSLRIYSSVMFERHISKKTPACFGIP